jgi:adenylosuccinate lyase
MNALIALSPLDGRYTDKTSALSPIFSEFGLIRCRVLVEIEWLAALCADPGIPQARNLTEEERNTLRDIGIHFSPEDGLRVKTIEAKTNHDVKAVEYFLKEKLKKTTMEPLAEFLHFACTSEDINNVAHALQLRDGIAVIGAEQDRIIDILKSMAGEFADVPMLARTHGQTASPTTVGKELAVFANRLERQRQQIAAIKLTAKLNGAVGNFNAHLAAYPDTDWRALAGGILESRFGLKQNHYTTQIESHDTVAELFHALVRWNTILISMNRDIWSYISMGYFAQKTVKGEVGSSTMPHKVNPIDFENSEGNLGIANALFSHLAEKLPISRLQRDLTDSTALRNMGGAFGYTLIACLSTLKGLSKLTLNTARLEEDLENAWEVMAEPIQTIMRKNGIANPYEQLKELTRGQKVTRETLQTFVTGLDIDPDDKKRLLEMTPFTYTGLASKLADAV